MTDEYNDQPDLSRRRLLTGIAVGGAAVAGGVVGGVATAAASSSSPFRRERLTLDVACLGDKWRMASAENAAGDDDFRQSFSVEGWLYPAGTIPGDGFVPTADGAIGHWLCRGWVMIDADRPEPHVMSVQEHILGVISTDRLFPTENLTSSGIEGTSTNQVATRSVIGGTGSYMGATGQVTQANNGTNTSVFADGSGDPGLNFVFEFDLLIPDL